MKIKFKNYGKTKNLCRYTLRPFQCSCIPEDEILSRSREEEVIDVRFILVKLLYEKGFYPRSISSLIGRGKTDVCYILRRFDERMECRKMMMHIYFTTVQLLKNK